MWFVYSVGYPSAFTHTNFVFPTEYVYGCRMILRTDSDLFPKHYSPTDFCNGDTRFV